MEDPYNTTESEETLQNPPIAYKKLLIFITWMFWPILFTLCTWLLFLFTKAITSALPTFSKKKSIKTLIPQYPKSLTAAYDIGTLVERFSKSEYADIRAGILQQMQEILCTNRSISEAEVYKMKDNMIKYAGKEGLMGKIKGAFNCINIIWLLSIVGIMFFVVPTAIWIFGNKIVWICEMVVEFVFFIRPLWTPLLFLFAFVVIAYGAKFRDDILATGVFVTLAGVLVSYGAFIVCTCELLPHEGGDIAVFFTIVFGWALLNLIPLALMLKSSFLGFLTVVAFFHYFGFSVVPMGLCYYVGFDNREELEISIIVSFVVLNIAIFSRILQRIENQTLKKALKTFLEIFGNGINVMGTVVLFLALLIFSFKWYSYYGHHNSFMYRYWVRQLLMVGAFVYVLIFGNLLNLNSMKNATYVYLVLYVILKVQEIGTTLDLYAPMALLICFILFFASLYAHRRPGLIVSLFKVD